MINGIAFKISSLIICMFLFRVIFQMARKHLQISLVRFNMFSIFILFNEHHLPHSIRWGAKKVSTMTFANVHVAIIHNADSLILQDFRRYCEILRHIQQFDTFIVCAWFLCHNCYDTMVESICESFF